MEKGTSNLCLNGLSPIGCKLDFGLILNFYLWTISSYPALASITVDRTTIKMDLSNNFQIDYSLPNMSNLCRVAIIVPYYNEENHISRCLESLVNQKLDSMELYPANQFEIICVNNNSIDKSTSIVREFIARHPDYRIFQINELRQGPAWARRKGVEIAIRRFVFSARNLDESIIAWIDGDSEADERWLVEITKTFQNPKIMAAAGDKCYSTDIFEHLCKTVSHAYLPGIIAQDMIQKIVKTLKSIRIPRLNGVNSAIRASTYIDVGGFEQPYHNRKKGELASGEEFELAEKILLKKYDIGFISTINLTSGRRLIDSWIRSALFDGLIYKAGETISTYPAVFTLSDEEFILKNINILQKVTKDRWKELFIDHIDGCIKHLVTRDILNAIKTDQNIQSVVKEIYGSQWKFITKRIRHGFEKIKKQQSGSLRFINGFFTTPELEQLTNNIFQISRRYVWIWLWSEYCIPLNVDLDYRIGSKSLS